MQYRLEVSSITMFFGGGRQSNRHSVEAANDADAIVAAEQFVQATAGLVGYLTNEREQTVAICYTIRTKQIELGVCTQTTGTVVFLVRSEAEALRRFAATTAPYRKILYGPTGMIANVATGEEATAAE